MKTLIAVPCFDMVQTQFMQSLMALQRDKNTSFTVVRNTLIHVARNVIAGNAIEAGFDRIMWFDSDMTFPPDTLFRLSNDMDKTGADLVTGLYFTRKPPIKPVIYKSLWWDNKEKLNVGAENDYNYNPGLVEIAGAGFGCCLTSVDIFRQVREMFGSPFAPLQGLGEDLSFCWRAIMVGARMYCDTDIKCGHVGTYEFSEKDYNKGDFIDAEG